ncbi:MAG TPA: ester cyclase [Myxococcota bacterium]|nr:ester cyclase [Myxococcota bacterium]
MNTPESLTQGYFRACNERDFALLDQVFAPGFVSHLRLGDVVGLPAFKALMVQFFEAFPDVHWTMQEGIYTADRGVMRYSFRGTHKAPFLGMAPSGLTIDAEGCEVAHIVGDKIVEIWNYTDLMGLAAQLRYPDPLAVKL